MAKKDKQKLASVCVTVVPPSGKGKTKKYCKTFTRKQIERIIGFSVPKTFTITDISIF